MLFNCLQGTQKRVVRVLSLCCAAGILASCGHNSIPAPELETRTDSFCTLYERQICQEGDISCIENERQHFCRCEHKAKLPKLRKKICAPEPTS